MGQQEQKNNNFITDKEWLVKTLENIQESVDRLTNAVIGNTGDDGLMTRVKNIETAREKERKERDLLVLEFRNYKLETEKSLREKITRIYIWMVASAIVGASIAAYIPEVISVLKLIIF